MKGYRFINLLDFIKENNLKCEFKVSNDIKFLEGDFTITDITEYGPIFGITLYDDHRKAIALKTTISSWREEDKECLFEFILKRLDDGGNI